MNRLRVCSYPQCSLEMVREDNQLFTGGDSATGAGSVAVREPQPWAAARSPPHASGSGAGRGARGCARHGLLHPHPPTAARAGWEGGGKIPTAPLGRKHISAKVLQSSTDLN